MHIQKREIAMAKAELSYNPYLMETEVKFNGRSPRINSLIEKHKNKKLQEWIKDIPSIFHDEMNGYNFDLFFTGTAMDFHELEKSFTEKGVSKDKIRLVFSKEMESRIIKTIELDDAVNWLDQNRSRVLDYDKFASEHEDLLFGPFSFIIIKGNVKAINLYDNLKIEPENVASVEELKTTDLRNTPILFYLDRSTLPYLQQGLSELLERTDISKDQIFFYIAASLRKRIVERIIQDLGIDNPQIVNSLQADCIKQYFEMFPVSDYISDSLIVLRNKTNEIREQITIEDQKRKEENVEKYALIKEYEDNISALKESHELFINRTVSDLTDPWLTAQDKMLGQIQKWQTRRTKVTGEANGKLWAGELDKQISKSFGEFTQELVDSFYDLKERIENNFASWYQKANMDVDYEAADVICNSFAVGTFPVIADELIELKEEEYVVPKEDNILGFMFKNQQKPQSEMVLENAYYFHVWRKYAVDLVSNRSENLINQAEEILTRYIDDLAKAYLNHIEFLIDEETKKKDLETASLSEEERLLQNDKDWLGEIEDKLYKIERE